MKWFKSIEDKIVDQVDLRNGKEVSDIGIEEFQMGKDAITGYLIINAENMDEAVKIAQSGPKITSTKVYEIVT